MQSKDPLKRVHVQDYPSTWSETSCLPFCGFTLRLLEHDDYGDDVASLIVVSCVVDGVVQVEVLLDDVWNGFDDLVDVDEDDLQAKLAKLERFENDRLAAEHIQRSTALFAASAAASVRCCSDPHVMGGKCENCGQWANDEVEK